MFGDMSKMMSQLQDAKKNVEEAKLKLNDILIESNSGNGLVNVTISASKQVKKIDINENLLSDKEALEDYLILALNDAITKADKIQEQEMAIAAKKGINFGF
ncbi:YbaB/EbfC family nucleoid-associated protein [Wenyingzhuangia sp. chi5]|uniref:Nucleoid-associated protein QVZ41_06465 n=1 Tax=Wenyingzhuangia gilva TaxID=3057677 RepID=A0ABT8VR86_9FLAO|nr:YbaB/EbfC family nucleoid-associated protein [Wenyingzhuangia sp. chi5]MDO3694488.1 YbaB/EbfC family nucleoid-associated protein [Wenyingzhuangia sp. chi5]